MGILSAHHQEFSTVHSALVSFLQFFYGHFQAVRMELGSEDHFQAESGWSSILTLFGNDHQNLHETYQCRTYSRELLMMGREDAQNM